MQLERRLLFIAVLMAMATLPLFAQVSGNVPDGTNKYQLGPLTAGINGSDSTGTDVGRDAIIVRGPVSLDGDNLTDIVVTDYQGSGRVHVFEQISANSLQFQMVWTSRTPAQSLAKNKTGPQSTPRTVAVGDFDGNGRKEIFFPIGYTITDTSTTDTTNPRGLHVYEWNGSGDNAYGSSPLMVIRPQVWDTAFNRFSWGRIEGQGLAVNDVDGDGNNELIIGSREFNFETGATLYILQRTSGTFATADIVINVEHKYVDMKYVNDDGLKPDSSDGFIPFGFAIADIDGDTKKEILVGGWVNVSSGSGLGFIDVPSANTYTDGTVMAFPGSGFGLSSMIQVSFRPAVYNISGQDFVYVNGDGGTARAFWVIDGVSDVSFVGPTNFKKISPTGFGSWNGLLAANQDHGVSTTDGFEIYFPNGTRVSAYEYNGTGDPTDSLSYTLVDTVFALNQVFRVSGGAITDVMGYDGMDLDGDGRREILVNYKPGTTDTLLNNTRLNRGTYAFFLVEWGDGTTVVTSVGDLSVIPDNYRLDQNYPNPFNPTTVIPFYLPVRNSVTLKVFDMLGREIRTLVGGQEFDAGNQKVEWNGRDNAGRVVATGSYIYRIEAGSFTSSRRMVLMK